MSAEVYSLRVTDYGITSQGAGNSGNNSKVKAGSGTFLKRSVRSQLRYLVMYQRSERFIFMKHFDLSSDN